jgi:hypothetical protein
MTLAALLGLLLAASPAAEAPLHVLIADSLSCPSAAQLLEALDQRIGPGRAILGGGGQGVAVLEVFAAQGSYFTVRLTSTSAHLTAEQSLDSHRGSCVELALAVALLVESWLRDMPSERDLVGLVPPDVASHSRAAAAPAVVKPVPDDLSPVSRTPGAQATASSEHQGYSFQLSLNLSLDAVVSTTTGLGATAGLEVALPAGFGIGARFALLPSLSENDPQGAAGYVTVDRFAGELIATYLFLPQKSETGLSAAGVVGLLALHAASQSFGYPQNGSATQWQIGGVVGGRGSWTVSKPFFLYGEVDLQGVPQPLNFQVRAPDGPDGKKVYYTVVTQPAWWISLSLGVGARFL